MHEKENPFCCDLCKKGFANAASLGVGACADAGDGAPAAQVLCARAGAGAAAPAGQVRF